MAFHYQRGKYGAARCEVDGISFASKREAARYRDLTLRRSAGEISDLRLQVPYPITAVNLETGELVTVARYLADFVYVRDGLEVIEDCKGFRTDVYRLKKKLVEAIHGVRIHEV